MEEIILQLELAEANLKNALAYCQEVNGRPDCKNCGLDETILIQVSTALNLCRKR
jgi:hypothetical protein